MKSGKLEKGGKGNKIGNQKRVLHVYIHAPGNIPTAVEQRQFGAPASKVNLVMNEFKVALAATERFVQLATTHMQPTDSDAPIPLMPSDTGPESLQRSRTPRMTAARSQNAPVVLHNSAFGERKSTHNKSCNGDKFDANDRNHETSVSHVTAFQRRLHRSSNSAAQLRTLFERVQRKNA